MKPAFTGLIVTANDTLSSWRRHRHLAAAVIVVAVGVGALLRARATIDAELARSTAVVEPTPKSTQNSAASSAAQQPVVSEGPRVVPGPASAPATLAAPAQAPPTLAPPAAVSTAETTANAVSHQASVTPTLGPVTTSVLASTQPPSADVGLEASSLGTATPAPAVATPTSSAGPDSSGYRTYVAQRGDSPNAIAASYGVSVASIIASNGIRNPDSLQVGQVLKIPPAGN